MCCHRNGVRRRYIRRDLTTRHAICSSRTAKNEIRWRLKSRNCAAGTYVTRLRVRLHATLVRCAGEGPVWTVPLKCIDLLVVAQRSAPYQSINQSTSLYYAPKHGQYSTRLCSEIANLHWGQNLNQKWSVIRIQISKLIRILIRMSAGSLPKCCEFITLSASVISPSVLKNMPVTVWEMLISLLKSPIPQWRGKWKSDPESVSGTRSPPKVNQFFRLVGPIITSSLNDRG